MNPASPQFIQLMINIIMGAGVLAIGVPYIKGQIKKGSINAQDESNQLLRNLVEDQKKSIEALECWKNEATRQIDDLKSRVDDLTSKKTDLEKLITVALVNYFKDNPDIACDVAGQSNVSQNV